VAAGHTRGELGGHGGAAAAENDGAGYFGCARRCELAQQVRKGEAVLAARAIGRWASRHDEFADELELDGSVEEEGKNEDGGLLGLL
jgi:hypothetical protein